MIWGGGLGKKTQRLLAQEKKTNSTTKKKKKLNSTTWKKKKLIMDLMLGCDALNMDKLAFYTLF